MVLEVGSNNVDSNSENIEYLNRGSKGVNIPFRNLLYANVSTVRICRFDADIARKGGLRNDM